MYVHADTHISWLWLRCCFLLPAGKPAMGLQLYGTIIRPLRRRWNRCVSALWPEPTASLCSHNKSAGRLNVIQRRSRRLNTRDYSAVMSRACSYHSNPMVEQWRKKYESHRENGISFQQYAKTFCNIIILYVYECTANSTVFSKHTM